MQGRVASWMEGVKQKTSTHGPALLEPISAVYKVMNSFFPPENV